MKLKTNGEMAKLSIKTRYTEQNQIVESGYSRTRLTII